MRRSHVRLLFVLEYFEETVRSAVANDQIFMGVDRDALWTVDVGSDDPFKAASDSGAIVRSVHNHTIVALVCNQYIRRPVETQSSRFVKFAWAAKPDQINKVVQLKITNGLQLKHIG